MDCAENNFALIGVAGYVAPRHLQAIRDTGNRLLAALDPSDSVGILDRYFPDTRFFTEFERFDRHAEKLRRQGEEKRIHYVSIASPNYLHDAHIRFALRINADAVCEKPMVLNPWNLDALAELEKEFCRRVYTVLQLRLHPSLIAFRDKIITGEAKHDIDLTYITSRGRWYAVSWKGDASRSGGVGTNIGIHFFDLLLWIFGGVQHSEVHLSIGDKMAGYLELERARVRWFLSIDRNDLPEAAVKQGKTTFRCLTCDGEEVEFSQGFTDLHTEVYRHILQGNGFGIEESRPSIQLAYDMRNAKAVGLKGEVHPLAAGLIKRVTSDE